MIQRGQVYQHYKGGLYVIESVGLNANDQTPMLSYRSLYDEKVWFHKQEDFLTTALDSKGQQVPRFSRIPGLDTNVIQLHTRMDTIGELRHHTRLYQDEDALVFCQEQGSATLLPMQARMTHDPQGRDVALVLLSYADIEE